jgi:hypothetical protein
VRRPLDWVFEKTNDQLNEIKSSARKPRPRRRSRGTPWFATLNILEQESFSKDKISELALCIAIVVSFLFL